MFIQTFVIAIATQVRAESNNTKNVPKCCSRDLLSILLYLDKYWGNHYLHPIGSRGVISSDPFMLENILHGGNPILMFLSNFVSWSSVLNCSGMPEPPPLCHSHKLELIFIIRNNKDKTSYILKQKKYMRALEKAIERLRHIGMISSEK
jgi:hypothetical protein